MMINNNTIKRQSIDLNQVCVRPILAEEYSNWSDLMAAHHYLGFTRLIGESLCYVATYQGNWLALIGWSSAALHVKARDAWIGWPQALKFDRLRYVINNTRFLLLPKERIPNLASRVLSLNLKRLSADWLKRHGHPVLLVETFVDPARYHGGCYRAANWHYLGKTAGFRKSAKCYIHHGEVKLIFVRELVRNARAKLLSPKFLGETTMKIKSFTKAQVRELKQLLLSIKESRNRRGLRHRQHGVLAIAICAILTGAKSYLAIAEYAKRLTQAELKRFGVYYHRKLACFQAPSEPTIRRVLKMGDAEAIDRALMGWLQTLMQKHFNHIALDGKTLRGAKDNEGDQVILLSAFLQDQGVVLRQIPVDKKTNEITQVEPLLAPLNIEGSVVTADALHTQKKTADYIVKKKAHYVLTVKDNQPTLKQDIEQLNLTALPPAHETLDKAHGRLETRRIWCSDALNNYLDFPHVGQVFMIQRDIEHLKAGKRAVETICGISSLSCAMASSEEILAYNRGHWGIENRLHYVRDTAYTEDHSQVRTNQGPRTLACLRNFAISVIRLLGGKNIASALRHFAASPGLPAKILGF